MTVSTTTNVLQDFRVYSQLPGPVKRWTAQGSVTGAAGAGNNILLFYFNPDQLVTFQPYVTLHSAYFSATVADPLDGMVFVGAGQWENQPQTHLYTLTTAIAQIGTWQAQVHQGISLGRVERGAVGAIECRFDEVNTSVMVLQLRGFISEFPILAPDHVWP